MTNILSTLRGSGTFCVKLVKNTSKLLSRILHFYSDASVGDPAIPDDDVTSIGGIDNDPGFPERIRLPQGSGFVPEAPSRSDSQCSCLSCAVPSQYGDRPRRPSRLNEGIQVETFYTFGELLGEGTFSKVYLAEPLTEPGGLVAVKVIDKSSLIRKKNPEGSNGDLLQEGHIQEYEDLRWLIDREILIMSALDHPHIIHLEEVYEDEDKVCFILELAKGGEVFDRLVEKVSFNEAEAAGLLVQLLCAVAFMHEQGIVHRDLKLENLLYYDDTEESKILVADFGLSEYEWELKEGSPVCGTPGYLAPEVIARQPCTTSADVWSIGVIAYILLAGYPPFFANPDEQDNDQTLFKKILTGDFQFHENAWGHISPEARDFIRCLLCPDPLQRPTCEEALCHPWLNDLQNLEMRAAQKRSLAHSTNQEEEDKWSVSQQAAFGLSLAIICYSYIGLLTYVFNLGDASAIFWIYLKSELLPRWSQLGDLLIVSQDSVNIISSYLDNIVNQFFTDFT